MTTFTYPYTPDLISWLWVWWFFYSSLDQTRTKICKSNLKGFVCNLQYAYVPLMKNADCEEFYTKVKLKLSFGSSGCANFLI